jgi:hypothetical protein
MLLLFGNKSILKKANKLTFVLESPVLVKTKQDFLFFLEKNEIYFFLKKCNSEIQYTFLDGKYRYSL